MTTDTGMVETVAQAIVRANRSWEDRWEDLSASEQKGYMDVARAVLECLRTPTPEMVEAMKVYVGGHESAVIRWVQANTPDAQSKIWAEQVKPTQDALYSSFTAMIDLALSPSEGEGE